jgi:hypothetical protein
MSEDLPAVRESEAGARARVWRGHAIGVACLAGLSSCSLPRTNQVLVRPPGQHLYDPPVDVAPMALTRLSSRISSVAFQDELRRRIREQQGG